MVDTESTANSASSYHLSLHEVSVQYARTMFWLFSTKSTCRHFKRPLCEGSFLHFKSKYVRKEKQRLFLLLPLNFISFPQKNQRILHEDSKMPVCLHSYFFTCYAKVGICISVFQLHHSNFPYQIRNSFFQNVSRTARSEKYLVFYQKLISSRDLQTTLSE